VSDAVIDAIAAAAPGATSDGDVITLGPDGLLAAATAAKEGGFEMCVDLTAVDYLDRHPRFEVVVNLLSQQHRRRLRIRCAVPADHPSVPSLTALYPGANFYEREVYDLFGISFEDHPDMTRILMPDDWEGHPLRKDYAVGSVPVQFKSSPTT
jgi:NADH-quinone oxidoreductase subunit C